MAIDLSSYNCFLERIAEDLDIPPSKYQQAVDRYESVGHWLEDGEYLEYPGELKIYPQGSFRLGTVVRPLVNGKEADYDIDLVCELPALKDQTEPESVKTTVGDRLKDNATYARLLDKEGRRCWTLNYAEQDGIGFHLDILPSVPDGNHIQDDSIAITHKEEINYSWSASNPNGYADWFHKKNQFAFILNERTQKEKIVRKSSMAYASIDKVPDQLVRTPLQMAIQIMKRHRDQRFNNGLSDHRPISMIITTLSAHLFANESDVFSALKNIIDGIYAHKAFIDNKALTDSRLKNMRLIERLPDGTWYIGNPVHPEENFADRWHEDNHARAKAFFKWVGWLRNDLLEVINSSDIGVIEKTLVNGLGDKLVNKNIDILVAKPVNAPAVSPRRVDIVHTPKPWRR